MKEIQVSYLGNPLLTKQASEVTQFGTLELTQTISDLAEKMKQLDVPGIAAPQIGVSKRIIRFGFEKRSRFPNAEPIPMTVLINPNYEILDNEIISVWEHCVSIPGLTGATKRFKKIRYWGYNENGERIERIAENIHAVLFQHEYDHLYGKLFIHQLIDPNKIGFIEEIKKYRPSEYGASGANDDKS